MPAGAEAVAVVGERHARKAAQVLVDGLHQAVFG